MVDLAIRNCRIVDGTGAAGYDGDVGIEGDRIAAVGDVAASAGHEIDAGGLTLAPGFIDIHTHSDYSLLIDGRGASALHQGVTTQINGNCGVSAFPVAADGPYLGPFESTRLRATLDVDWSSAGGYFNRLARQRVGINCGFFVGHGAVRQAAMGHSPKAPTSPQRRRMQELVAVQMEEGAFGLSTGLTYVPGTYADTDEIAALAAATAPFGGIYATHMRNYTAGIMEALDEAIAIGQQAAVPVHVSHITPCPPATGSAAHLIERMDQARVAGIDVTADTEFYATGSTSLRSLLPPWALEGGNAEMVERLRQPALRQRMWEQVEESGSELGGSTKTVLMQQGRWDLLWLGNCDRNADLTGKSFAEIGARRECHPFEAICEILVEEEGAASFFGRDKTDADIDVLARDPHCGLGSDGLALASDGPLGREREHPRCYGGMAYLLQSVVRERGTLSLEQAVEKVTRFPAARLGLAGRGVVREGAIADLVLFDPATIADRATIVEPRTYAAGVRWLFVNGEAALADGAATGARSGRVLRACESREENA